jgi:CTP synthase (UTP-ammonia lyase)
MPSAKFPVRIALIGDYDPDVTAHQAIPRALSLASNQVKPEWLATEAALHADLHVYEGFWCVPASPYRSMEGALRAIQFARENRRPYLGTCGGCQHAILEFARNVLHIHEAGHTESDPATREPVITSLECALIEASETLRTVEGTRFREIYGAAEIRETYRCSYGINPDYLSRLTAGGLRVGVVRPKGEARAFELPAHPFFFATLYQPERSALRGESHPLISEFVATVTGQTQQKTTTA